MKFMNTKRFASTVMAGALALSLATPAFAAANTTVITGTYQDIEIAVEVPTTGTAQLNPYGLPVSIDKSDRTTATISDQKITSQPLSLKNQGATALDVYATLAVLPKGDVSIGTAADNEKKIKVDLEVAALNDSALAVASTERTLEDLLIDRFANDASWANSKKLAAPIAAKAATTVTPAKAPNALASLGAATVEGAIVTYGPKSIALVRLSGDLAEDPVDAASDPNPWKTTDGFEATVVFSFKPTPKTAVTVSGTGVTNPSSPKAYEGEEVTFTFEATAGKACTAVVTGMAGTAPAVTITEDAGNAGHYTGKFTMPADDTTAGITVTVTVPA
ncbi:MAG: hypothetical protein K2P26_11065 [Oscillospiraceae bacterium]|nr:hypothetical protein [Oscillospiraceae bacterium]